MSEFDFSGAFKQGLSAARQAEASRMEIREVIQDLSRQINVATDGQLEMEILQHSPAVQLLNYFTFTKQLASLSPPLSSPQPEEPKDTSGLWICARNVKSNDDSFLRLAQWEQPHEGYPCTVTVSGKESRCHDKEALQNTLAAMLSDAWVGERLRQLLSREKRPESGD
jgi:hypothetical protein